MSSICDTQDKFDQAFYNALTYSKKEENKKISTALKLYCVLHFLFILWGIYLALQTPKEQRVVNITLAIVFAPAYVLSYYLNQIGES